MSINVLYPSTVNANSGTNLEAVMGISYIPLLPRRLKIKQVIFIPHKMVPKNTDFFDASLDY